MGHREVQEKKLIFFLKQAGKTEAAGEYSG
jgi:hypothetical protein